MSLIFLMPETAMAFCFGAAACVGFLVVGFFFGRLYANTRHPRETGLGKESLRH